MFSTPVCRKYSLFLNELRERKEKWQVPGGLICFPAVIFTCTSLTRGSYSTANHCLETVRKKKNVHNLSPGVKERKLCQVL